MKNLLNKIIAIILIFVVNIISITTFSAYALDNDDLNNEAVFAAQQSIVWDGTIATGFAGGSGTQADPWLISNGAQLAYLIQQITATNSYSGKYFKQTADILLNDLSNLNNWSTTAPSHSWTPNTVNFSGNYDGDYFAVRGIYISNSTLAYGGLFGATFGATFKNIRVEASYIYSTAGVASYVGGIAGACVGGTITNCYNAATVIINEPTANVHHMVGGIIGAAANGATVSQCYNSGSISCTGNNSTGHRKAVGGIAGYINTNGSLNLIQDCYNTGAVSSQGGLNAAGGITGLTTATAYSMKNCYNTGLVTATAGTNYIGGIVGFYSNAGTVTNCYYLDGTATLNYSGGNDTYKMTADAMKNSDFLTTLNAEAFISDIHNINKGYPVFSWQNEMDTVTVTYDATYGENGPGSRGYYKGTYITLDFTNVPTGSFAFLGWSTEQGAATPEYTSAQNLMFAVNSDMTLYAVWDIDELDYAIMQGKTAEYIAEKKPIVDVLNSAIASKNKTVMIDFFTGDGELTIAKIPSIDASGVKALYQENQEKFGDFLDRLITYSFFKWENVNDVYYLEDILTIELAVGKMNDLPDIKVVERIMGENNSVYNLALTNKYYLNEKDIILAGFINKKFASLSDLQNRFTQAYVMTNFADTDSYSYIGQIVADCADEIGYDAEKYNKISDKNDLYKQLLKNQSSIGSIAQLSKFIDEYKPTPTSTPDSGSKKSSSNKSGGSSFKIPSNIIPIDKAEENTTTAVAKKQIYSDVPIDNWSYEAIRYLTAKHAVNGYENGGFLPDNNVTRAEFIKMLLMAFEMNSSGAKDETENEEIVFKDISKEDWYYSYMKAAKDNKILLGDSENNCYPNSLLTRQEMTAFIYRAVEAQGKTLPKLNDIINFKDKDMINDWAFGAVAKLQVAGIINGYADMRFEPSNNATRSEAAKVIYETYMKAEVHEDNEINK